MSETDEGTRFESWYGEHISVDAPEPSKADAEVETRELIADARDFVEVSREMRHGMPSHADMIEDLADALESAAQSEPSDAQVRAACSAYEAASIKEYANFAPMRAALRAAGGVE